MPAGLPADPAAARPSPAGILLLSAWVGLMAGFADLGLLSVKAFLDWRPIGFLRGTDPLVGLDPRFTGLNPHFPWMVPLGVLLVVMAMGTALALVALPRTRRLRPSLIVFPLAGIGALDVALRLPGVQGLACVILASGVAVQATRRVRPDGPRLRRLMAWTTPSLAVLLVILMAASFGRPAWRERRIRAALPPAPAAEAPNVLLVVLDTVRAQNLSLHGYERPTTPNLERLAERGVCFERAFATAGWTYPSHASIFTGRWPDEFTNFDLEDGWQRRLDDRHPTLSEFLSSRGYDTAGFVANTNYCHYETGLRRGFARYEDFPVSLREILHSTGLGHRAVWAGLKFVPLRVLDQARHHTKEASRINRDFLRWLSGRRGRDRPFFAFLNYFDAHDAYLPPEGLAGHFGRRPRTLEEFVKILNFREVVAPAEGHAPGVVGYNEMTGQTITREDVALAVDLYDDCIRYLDAQLGGLVAELDRRGVLDETLVIITSDHGEHFGEHVGAFNHGRTLYRQETQVPLLILAPEGVPAGRRQADPVSLRDVPATVLDLIGHQGEAPFPGQSLARFWSSRADPGSEIGAMPFAVRAADEGATHAVVGHGMHLIRNADGREELYDLATDPREREDLLAGEPSPELRVLGPLRRALERLSSVEDTSGADDEAPAPAPGVMREPAIRRETMTAPEDITAAGPGDDRP